MLCKVDKGHVGVHILFLAVFLKLSCCRDHIYVPLSFLNPHWLSGRSSDCSRCSFNRFSRTIARIFPELTIKRCLNDWHRRGLPFLLNRWIVVASLNSWGMASFLHIMRNNCQFLCNWSTSCFVDLCRYCIWSWSLARWQEFYCFHCFRDGWELIKQRITFHLLVCW